MIEIYDTKLWGIKFNLDAEYIGEKSIILDVDGFLDVSINDRDESVHVICPCLIVFVAVSGLSMSISDGSFQKEPISYCGGVHLVEIEKNTETTPYSWLIQLADESYIKIQCDSVRVEVFSQFKREIVGANTFLPLSVRTSLMLNNLSPSDVYVL
jgi:hypothetical protein